MSRPPEGAAWVPVAEWARAVVEWDPEEAWGLAGVAAADPCTPAILRSMRMRHRQRCLWRVNERSAPLNSPLQPR